MDRERIISKLNEASHTAMLRVIEALFCERPIPAGDLALCLAAGFTPEAIAAEADRLSEIPEALIRFAKSAGGSPDNQLFELSHRVLALEARAPWA